MNPAREISQISIAAKGKISSVKIYLFKCNESRYKQCGATLHFSIEQNLLKKVLRKDKFWQNLLKTILRKDKYRPNQLRKAF